MIVLLVIAYCVGVFLTARSVYRDIDDDDMRSLADTSAGMDMVIGAFFIWPIYLVAIALIGDR